MGACCLKLRAHTHTLLLFMALVFASSCHEHFISAMKTAHSPSFYNQAGEADGSAALMILPLELIYLLLPPSFVLPFFYLATKFQFQGYSGSLHRQHQGGIKV